MNIIEMKIVGENIAIAFQLEIKAWTATRHINADEAYDLGLLLTGGTFPFALNFEVENGLALQIENHPYDRAWLSMFRDDDVDERERVVVCVEGDTIRELGSNLIHLHDIVVGATSRRSKRPTYRLLVEHFYLDDGEALEPD